MSIPTAMLRGAILVALLGAPAACRGATAMPLAEIERALADHPPRWGDGDARAAVRAALDQQVSIQIRRGWGDEERARLRPMHEFYLHRVDAGLDQLE